MGLCSQQKEEEPKRSLAGLKLDAGMEDLSVGNIYVWGQWSSCTRSCGSGEWQIVRFNSGIFISKNWN